MKISYLNNLRLLIKVISFLSVSCVMLIAGSPAMAQTGFEVSGVVTDSFTGDALPGAHVAVAGTDIGTTTGPDGRYEITAPDGDAELVFTFISYETLLVSIDGQSEINVEMRLSYIMGDDIVVTGYSIQRRADLTGSVGVVDVDNFQRMNDGMVTRQLQGQVSGVIVTSSGQPGDSPAIRIRGIGSFGHVSPLYVVDGVATDDVSHLNPQDIASMQVLKDASAASIYGSRAANGVIIITTKEGAPGMRINFNSTFGWTTPPSGNPYDIASPQDMANLQWMALQNSGVTPTSDLYGSGSSPVLPDFIAPVGASEGDVNMDNYYVNPHYTSGGDLNNFYRISRANHDGTNWFQELFNPAATTINNLSVSGGNNEAAYLMSLNYHNQQGTLMNTYLERYTARVNTRFNITDNFRVGENLSYSVGTNPTAGILEGETDIAMAYRMQPIIPVKDVMGNYAGAHGAPLGNAQNPVANRDRSRHNLYTTNRLFGNAYAELDLLDDRFTVRTNFGLDLRTTTGSEFTYPQYENVENRTSNSYFEETEESIEWTWTNTITYNETFNDVHNLTVVAGTEAIENSWSGRYGSDGSFFSFDQDFVRLGAGSDTPVVNSWEDRIALISQFGRIDYNYNGRYLASATIRRDGTSKFINNTYGVFPAGSLGWRISNESFMSDVNNLDNLLLRGSYGIMGNQFNVDADNAFTVYAANPDNTHYPINRSTGTLGFARDRFGNPDAQWESVVDRNFGFNLVMFGGVLELDLDYYHQDVEDLLYNPSLPATAGNATQPYVNVGLVENKGIDAMLITRHAISTDLNFTASLSITSYNNKIVRITDEIEHFSSESRRFDGAIIRNEAGQPMSSFYGYKVVGFWNSQSEIDEANAGAPSGVYQDGIGLGRFKYEDITGDGEITPDDRTFLGDPHPDFTFGLNLQTNYRNLDASVFIYGSYGNDIWNQVKWWTDFYPSFQGAKSNTAVHDSWRPDNQNATAPIQENEASFSTNMVPNSYYVEDGSYLRVRNVQVGYTLPATTLQQIGIRNFRVFAQVQNLFTITGYSGPDPEIGATSSSIGTATAAFGIDEGSYPTMRQFLIGVNLEI